MMLRVLGPLEVDGPDGRVSVGGPVPRRILAALIPHAGSVCALDSLIAAAWGDSPPASADRTLVSHLTRLREALARADGADDARIERTDGGYRLRVGPDAVDAVRFERAVQAASGLSPGPAVSALREALGLWRSPVPYADLQDTAYPSGEAARLLELRATAVESLAVALMDDGQAGSAVAVVRERLAEDAFRERLWELLILALYRQGRQGDALGAYQEARSQLRDGLGVDPGPGLRDLEARVLAQDPGLLAPVSRVRQPCPYKGLARYDTGDAELFVGRERLVEELVGRLVDRSLVVVVGPSGAGKSSVVRAGLVPALAQGALPGSAEWSMRVVVPGAAPLEVLTEALAGQPDLLVVDQAEEALLADNGGCVLPVGDRVLAATASGTRVVLVLRADFYGLLAGHGELARRAGPATVLVGPPGEGDLRRILTEPALRVGLGVEPALVDLVVAEVRDRPGVLPILSTALVRTWENRDRDLLSVASYRTGGGVTAALESVGEEAWAALDDDPTRGACRRILLRLAVNENGTWVRRWARRDELVGQDQAAQIALGVLTQRRLIVARADDLSVAHEALLIGWPRLHGWLEDGRARAQTRERLAAAAATWQDDRHDPAALYRGTRLQAALDMAAASPEDITVLEHTFLRESADHADRELKEQRARAEREARGRRRIRLIAAGLAIALALAGLTGAYAVVQQRQAVQSAVVADASRLGALARSTGDYDRALLLAAQAVKLNPSPGTESDLFATLVRGDAVLTVLRAALAPVDNMAFTPDGRGIVAATAAGDLIRWRSIGGPAATVAHLDVTSVATGREVIVASEDTDLGEGVLETLDPATGRVLAGVSAREDMTWALSPDRRVAIFAAVQKDMVSIWRLGADQQTVRSVNIGDDPVMVVACGSANACVLTKHNRLVRVSVSAATVQQRFDLPPNPDQRIIASADGTRFAVADPAAGILRLLDARTGREVRQFKGASRDLRALAFSPDGTRIVASDDASILIWPTDRDALPDRYDVQGGKLWSAEWSADGSTLATLGVDGAVVLLDMTGKRRLGVVLTDRLGGQPSTMWALPKAIAVGQVGGRLLFVDSHTGRVQEAHGQLNWVGEVESARAGQQGDLLVTNDDRGLTAVWDVATRRLLGTVQLPAANDPSNSMDPQVWVSPDGTQAATMHSWEGVLIFDPRTRQGLRRLPAPPDTESAWVTAIEGWSRDGRLLLMSQQSSARQSGVLLVDARTGDIRLRIDTGTGYAREMTEDPTGRYLAIVTDQGKLLLRDVHDGHQLAPPLPANDGSASTVSVSPDGRYISTSGTPPRVTIWDTRTFRQVGIPLPLDINAPQSHARFAPDGRLIVLTGNVLRAFTIDPSAWLARACREAGRHLDRSEFEEVLPGQPYDPACT